MSSTPLGGEREKLVSTLPTALRRALDVRAAQLRTNPQDAVAAGIRMWRATTEDLPVLDTASAESFDACLPEGLHDAFTRDCQDRGVSSVQGLAQAVDLWLNADRAPAPPPIVRRIVVCNQKGGVGKTAIAGGVAQALAETPSAYGRAEDGAAGGQRVLVIDFDPQGHLSHQLGLKAVPAGQESLITHMLERDKVQQDLIDLTVPVEGERFGGRLRILPAAFDAFLLDSALTVFRGRRYAALERALQGIEEHFDVILIDSPPSLGLAMDTALYYARVRADEKPGRSGLLVPVEAEDTSAQAYGMLIQQIDAVTRDFEIEIEQLGLVVNKFDSRRGFIATSSRDKWQAMGTPPVLAVVPDLKEQREAVRLQTALLSYAPECEQSHRMRAIARELRTS
ncbi:ParA family protein [Streptomyces sp. NPDC087917]|uniref:ParA family protein n=1 Tax=Streptomyces sp. NPDC087917 TaxID=3155060 RepID=UPI00342BF85B